MTHNEEFPSKPYHKLKMHQIDTMLSFILRRQQNFKKTYVYMFHISARIDYEGIFLKLQLVL